MENSLPDRAYQLQSLLKQMRYSLGNNYQEQNNKTATEAAVYMLAQARENGSTVYLIGNGGSAAIVSHAKTDLMNTGKIKAVTLLESSIITCLGNDYGYEQVFSRQLEVLANPDDILIAVSSSGASKNILNAVDVMHQKRAKVISLSGFDAENPLRKMGELNYWIDSKSYTLIEIAHLFVLHHFADCLNQTEIGK